MAPERATLTSIQMDHDLEDIGLELNDLPWTAEEWSTWFENSQCSYALDWDNLMGSLKYLAQAYDSGQMTEDQQARYRDVVRRLREALSTIQKLKLSAPVVSLDIAA